MVGGGGTGTMRRPTTISDAVRRDSDRSRAQELAKQLASEDGTIPVIGALDRVTA